MSPRLLTARQVGDVLGVNPETVLRWYRRGDLPAIRLPGGPVRFVEDELDAWLAERATAARGSVSHPAGRRPLGSVPLVSSATPEDEEN